MVRQVPSLCRSKTTTKTPTQGRIATNRRWKKVPLVVSQLQLTSGTILVTVYASGCRMHMAALRSGISLFVHPVLVTGCNNKVSKHKGFASLSLCLVHISSSCFALGATATGSRLFISTVLALDSFFGWVSNRFINGGEG